MDVNDTGSAPANHAVTASGADGPRRARARWGTVGLTVVIVAVVGGLVAAAFAVATNDGSHVASPATTATTTPSAAATSPTTTGSSTAATGAKPAVCGNVQGVTVMADDMVMAPVPNRPPSASDETAAQKLVASVNAGIAKYSNLSAAVAAGYVPATNPNGYVVHYANWSVVQAGDVLDASRPSSLVYANTVSGPVLLGAMFLGPAPCRPGPDVAGPLTQWHAHANLCLSATHEVVGRSSATGQCAAGNHNTNTYFMMHVWIAPSLAQSYQFAAHVPATAYATIIRSGKA
jgi:hypothetical protein